MYQDNESRNEILNIKFEEFLKRFEIWEQKFNEELRQINLKLEKLESLRERIVQLETCSNVLEEKSKSLENMVIGSLKDTNSFLKRISIELSITIVGIILSLVYIILKK